MSRTVWIGVLAALAGGVQVFGQTSLNLSANPISPVTFGTSVTLTATSAVTV